MRIQNERDVKVLLVFQVNSPDHAIARDGLRAIRALSHPRGVVSLQALALLALLWAQAETTGGLQDRFPVWCPEKDLAELLEAKAVKLSFPEGSPRVHLLLPNHLA